MKNQRFPALIVFLVGLGLAACEGTRIGSNDPNVSGVQARATLDFVQAVQTSTAQSHKAAEWQATVQAAATEDAMKWTSIAAQATDASAHRAAIATQTQQAWSVTATSESIKAASTASANATASSWAGTTTQVVWNRQATVEAANLQTLQTAQAAEAEMALLSVERQRMFNDVQAAAPWVVLAVVVVLAAYLAWIWGKAEVMRRRAIPRDVRGDAPILLLEDHGRHNVIDPDLFFGAVVTITRDGKPESAVLTPLEYQSQVKARDQAVDMANRGLPGTVQRSRALPAPMAEPVQSSAIVRIVDPGEVKDWLSDVMPEIQRKALEEGYIDGRNR